MPKKTGLFFEDQTPESLLEAIWHFSKLQFDPTLQQAAAKIPWGHNMVLIDKRLDVIAPSYVEIR